MSAARDAKWIRLVVGLGLALAGCSSPEEERTRGAGSGADGGNYPKKPIHDPSKIDGTKAIPANRS